MLGLSRNQKLQTDICKILEQYKEGKVYTYNPENRESKIESVRPYYHNSVKWEKVRRYRFNICKENAWNRIILDKDLTEKILNKIKNLLNQNNIKYKDVKLDSYYPAMQSRMQYASWISCLDIYA